MNKLDRRLFIASVAAVVVVVVLQTFWQSAEILLTKLVGHGNAWILLKETEANM